MEYGEQANGREVDTKVNDNFEIVLPEVRTAGYRWNIEQNGEPAVQLLEDTTQPDAARPGSAGRHRWTFRAASAGDSEIKLQYSRSWESPVKPTRTFTLKVRVQS